MKKLALSKALSLLSSIIVIVLRMSIRIKKQPNLFLYEKSTRVLSARFLCFRLMILILVCASSYGQIKKAFVPRFPGGNRAVKGDVMLVGNTILGVTTTDAKFDSDHPLSAGIPKNLNVLTAEANLSSEYNWRGGNFDGPEPTTNNKKNMEYIDVDTDPNTFSSSSAELHINSTCKEIVYAGLYWTAIYPNDRIEDYKNGNSPGEGTTRKKDWNQMKFKVPGAADYVDIIADVDQDADGYNDEIIFNGYVNNNGDSFGNASYVCYKDVTGLLQALPDPNGNYFGANIRACRGRRRLGSMGAWTLVIVYKDQTLPSKHISIFDGFASINGNNINNERLDFTVSGFQTPPAPIPVRPTIGVVAQEGELGYDDDDLQIMGSQNTVFSKVFNDLNPIIDVFNSTISIPYSPSPPNAVHVKTRNPSRENTFGFDMDLFNIANENNAIIHNNENSITYRLTSEGDEYALFLTTFAVDIIEPKIILTKTIKNAAGNNIANMGVNLGDVLNYEIGFQNKGNDDATSVTIKEILPANVIFNYPQDLVLPSGVTVDPMVMFDSETNEQISGYDPVTRTIVFDIAYNLVKINTPQQTIKLNTKVIPTCDELKITCGYEIRNQVYVTYRGVLNNNLITDNPSVDNCGIINGDMNFIENVAGCTDGSTYILCPPSVAISAAEGYESYSWSMNSTGIPVIGTTRTIDAVDIGTYYVHCKPFEHPNPNQPCTPLDEEIKVVPFGMSGDNPLGPFSDEEVVCPINNIKLPNFYLCKDKPNKNIHLSPPNGASIIWEKSNCPPILNTVCADKSSSCTWTQVATGSDFIITDSGQYRVVFNFGNGCSIPYFFNVHGILTPVTTSQDIFCETSGKIIVDTPAKGSGYEYSLDDSTYGSNADFSIVTSGIYTVYIKPIASKAGRCSFVSPPIEIKKHELRIVPTVPISIVKCYNDKGSITLEAQDVRGKYVFSIKGSTMINEIKTDSISANSHIFTGLLPDIYDVRVTTEDKCEYNHTFTISGPTELVAKAELSKPITCQAGEIKVIPEGGIPPYTFIEEGNNIDPSKISSQPVFYPAPITNTPVIYKYYIKDSNDCISNKVSLTVNPLPTLTPEVTQIKPIKCYGELEGEINVTATGGLGNYVYNLLDSNGAALSLQNSGNFTQLPAGFYKVSVVSGNCGPVLTNSIQIIQPPQLTTDKKYPYPTTCAGTSDGKIIIEAVGGTGKIQYAISPRLDQFFDTGIFSNLKAGSYTIKVKDENNCHYPEAFTIGQPNPIKPSIVPNSIKQELCFGEKTGAFIIAIEGGTTPYSTSLDNVEGTYTEGKFDFSGQTGGNHTVYILDKNQCKSELLVPLDPAVILKPIGEPNYDCMDNVPANKVIVKIDASNTNRSLIKYSMDRNGSIQDDNVFVNVSPGDHFVVARHNNGCDEPSPRFTVDKLNSPLSISLNPSVGLNEIAITIDGGSGIYQYSINGESIGSTNKYRYYNSGDYTANVEDSNGCQTQLTKYFEFIDIEIPNIFTPNGSGINDTWMPIRTDNYPNLKFTIYDRYSREVGGFGYGQSWDGKYKGTDLPTGDYWYVLKLRSNKDDREFIGHFTLYR